MGLRKSDSTRQIVTRRAHRNDRSRYRRSRRGAITSAIGFAIDYAKPLAVVATLLFLILGYRVVAGSSLFELKRVNVAGASDSLRPQVEQAVRRAVNGAQVLEIDLGAVRRGVESLRRVGRAWVFRVLPDELRIEVEERRPEVLVRSEAEKLVWLDREAVDIGELSGIEAVSPGNLPPVAKGFSFGLSHGNRTPTELLEDKERVEVYKEIERELNRGPRPLWNLIDQIDLNIVKDVHVYVATPPVAVKVGSQDFFNRFDTALRVLDAIRRGDSELLRRYGFQDPESLIQNVDGIRSIDLSRSDRVVIPTPVRARAVQQEKKPKEAAKKETEKKKK
jgi:hypothetical protein